MSEIPDIGSSQLNFLSFLPASPQRALRDLFFRGEPSSNTSFVQGPDTKYLLNRSDNPRSYNTIRGVIAQKFDLSKVLVFQFNPEEITDKKSVSYADRERPGFDNSDFIWISGGPRTISFKLILNSTESSNLREFGKPGVSLSIRDNPTDFSKKQKNGSAFTHNYQKGTLEQVEFLQALQRPLLKKSGTPRFVYNGAVPADQFSNPPELIFNYGPIYLEGILADLEVTHTRFNEALVPTHSECNVVIRVSEGQLVVIDNALNSYNGINLQNLRNGTGSDNLISPDNLA